MALVKWLAGKWPRSEIEFTIHFSQDPLLNLAESEDELRNMCRYGLIYR